MSKEVQLCCVCGGKDFQSQRILWDALVDAWQLAPEEAAYIDRQQGTACTTCGCNLRSQALAKAILSTRTWPPRTFRRLLLSPAFWMVKMLEVNSVGTLSPLLRRLPRRTLATYPQVDMQQMPYPDHAFDLVLHSDTLEHVPDPRAALAECRRVLRPGGWCCFTIPMIVGRMTRSRTGLSASYHGLPADVKPDFLVHTEYGADCWAQVLEAGFDECRLITVEYPAAQAIAARTPTR